MERSWLWDKKISLQQLKNIFKDESHPRFIEFSSLLLSRKNIPKEIFGEYFSPIVFCRNWQKIKKRMRQDNWNDPRIEFWQAVYEKLRQGYKQKAVNIFPDKKETAVISGLSYEVAQKIIAMRKYNGLTQKALAKKTRFSQQMISRIEKGRQNISLMTLKKIADSMNCKVKIDFLEQGSDSANQ